MLSEDPRGTPDSYTTTPTFSYDLMDKPSPAGDNFLHPGYFDLRRPRFPVSRRRSSLRLSKRLDDTLPAGESPFPLEDDSRQRQFSFKRLRHASDPQLSTRFTEEAPAVSPLPYEAAPAPTVGYTTSPPSKEANREKKPKRKFFQQFSLKSRTGNTPTLPIEENDKRSSAVSLLDIRKISTSSPRIPEDPAQLDAQYRPASTQPRFSESSVPMRPEPGEVRNQRPSLPARAASSRSRLFRLPMRRDKSESLFPLPVRTQPPQSSLLNPSSQSRPSSASSPTKSYARSPFVLEPSSSPQRAESPRKDSLSGAQVPMSRAGSHQNSLLGPSLMRHESSISANSETSLSAMPPPSLFGIRGRSSTVNSVRVDDEWSSIPGYQASGHNSEASTTLGRNSIAGLRSLTSRLRYSSEPQSPQRPSPGGGMGSSGVNSHSNSFALSRETLVVPEREEGETSGKYYARLESDISKRSIAALMSKSADPFSGDVLRSLMRTFKFYEEPMDISMRRFLWEIDLPGEAQQIDRVMSAFSERYHECNPHIFDKPDQAYLAAYSLIILHSDLFNKNNKHKMQKVEYQKNTGGHGIPDEILGYFYDNIQYTEFIAEANDNDVINKHIKGGIQRSKKPRSKDGSDMTRSGKLDPYDFIVDNKQKLETLRPPLKEILNLEDNFNFVGVQDALDVNRLHASFSRCGLLQLVSARSRPEAFTSLNTISNPNEANPGLVNIQVVKAGLLWRKDTKKKKTRSPWQEWGAILTPSQLYFFKNVGWVKTLMQQFETQQRHQGHRGSYLFKPPLSEFKPDLGISANNAVALLDSNYKKHKNAFVYYQSSGGDYFEEVLLADNEPELVDWLAKLNYAATLTTTKLALRPLPLSERTDFKELLDGVSGASSKPADAQRPPTQADTQDESAAQFWLNEAKIVRRNIIQAKIAYVEDNIPKAVVEVEENLKVARHLQILAPFPEKTRRDLLVSGARVAHRLRTARYAVWRWRCQRDILYKELDVDEHYPADHLAVANPGNTRPSTPMSIALSRLNSKTSILTAGHRGPKPPNHVSRNSTQSITFPNRATDPEAHLSPPDGPHQKDLRTDGLSRLASYSTNIEQLESGNEKPTSEPTDDHSLTQHGSIASRVSEVDPVVEREDTLPLATPTHSINSPEMQSGLLRSPSTNLQTDKDYITPTTTPLGSPDSKIKVRRSLHRTLRESRDIPGLQSSRSKKIKDNGINKTNAIDSTPTGGLPRGTGSFTVHGKKASVITLGSEWQSMSAEELLRSRKQALGDDSKSLAQSPPSREGAGGWHLAALEGKEEPAQTPRRSSEEYVTGDERLGPMSKARYSASSAGFDSDAFFDVEESYEDTKDGD